MSAEVFDPRKAPAKFRRLRCLNSVLITQSSALLPNNPVCSRQLAGWNRKADLLRWLEIDHQLEFGRLLDRQVGGLRSFEDFIDVNGCATIPDAAIGSV